eukprot:1268189-Pleurochrysis_carterae.AAC.2
MNVTAPAPPPRARHRSSMATIASEGAAQMFFPTTIPISESLVGKRGETWQGGRARLAGASRRGGGVASGPSHPSGVAHRVRGGIAS